MALAATAGMQASASAGPLADHTVTVEPAPGAESYDPAAVALRVNQDPVVAWQWGPFGNGAADTHNVRHERGLFSSGAAAEDDSFARTFSAGTFDYFCTVHPDMEGEVAAEPGHVAKPELDPRFRVVWAPAGSQTGDVFDVKYRREGGRWRTWKTDARKGSALFGRRGNPVPARCGKLYHFKARSQRSGKPGKRSDWSPVHEYLACD